MSGPSRFPDWADLSRDERAAELRRCRSRFAMIGRRLNAVAAEFPRDEGETRGALDGFPYAAKDMIATGHAAPSWGCAKPVDPGSKIAPVIERIDDAGAVLLGAAEMTELAYEPSGLNAARGPVVNPWNAERVPGGSSSGSAALVAAGCCFAALGSDTGGSVRIPAHCCGVTALKPTNGALPEEGTMPLAPSLDTIGVLARSASDLAMVWPVVSGNSSSGAMPPTSVVAMIDAIAASSPEIAAAAQAAIASFAKLGFQTSERAGFPEQADKNALIVMQAEAARAHRNVLNDERVDAVLRKRFGKGLSISDEQLAAALDERNALRAAFTNNYLAGNSVALLPVMPIVVPAVAETDPLSASFNAKTLYAMSRFTRFANYLGLPALAIPAGFDSRGLPVALQLIGTPNSEFQLLEIAIRFQSITDWHGRIPLGVMPEIASERELAA